MNKSTGIRADIEYGIKKTRWRERNVTWASASSLKALTRESSFSFSSAHWRERQTEDIRAFAWLTFWNFWSFLHKSSCLRPKTCLATSPRRCRIGGRMRLNKKVGQPWRCFYLCGRHSNLWAYLISMSTIWQKDTNILTVNNLFPFLPLWKTLGKLPNCQAANSSILRSLRTRDFLF